MKANQTEPRSLFLHIYSMSNSLQNCEIACKFLYPIGTFNASPKTFQIPYYCSSIFAFQLARLPITGTVKKLDAMIAMASVKCDNFTLRYQLASLVSRLTCLAGTLDPSSCLTTILFADLSVSRHPE
jgi:hypothetical protein